MTNFLNNRPAMTGPCGCIGPKNGEPYCNCVMINKGLPRNKPGPTLLDRANDLFKFPISQRKPVREKTDGIDGLIRAIDEKPLIRLWRPSFAPAKLVWRCDGGLCGFGIGSTPQEAYEEWKRRRV